MRTEEAGSSIDFAWDLLDRPVREVQGTSGVETVIDFAWDAHDRRIRRTMSTAGGAGSVAPEVTEWYVWNLGNRLTEVRFQSSLMFAAWNTRR